MLFAFTFCLSLDLREWTPSRPVSQRGFRQNVETVTAPRSERLEKTPNHLGFSIDESSESRVRLPERSLSSVGLTARRSYPLLAMAYKLTIEANPKRVAVSYRDNNLL